MKLSEYSIELRIILFEMNLKVDAVWPPINDKKSQSMAAIEIKYLGWEPKRDWGKGGWWKLWQSGEICLVSHTRQRITHMARHGGIAAITYPLLVTKFCSWGLHLKRPKKCHLRIPLGSSYHKVSRKPYSRRELQHVCLIARGSWWACPDYLHCSFGPCWAGRCRYQDKTPLTHWPCQPTMHQMWNHLSSEECLMWGSNSLHNQTKLLMSRTEPD